MNADDILTAITEAPTNEAALDIMRGVHSRALLLAVADQLYIDPIAHTSAWLRETIVMVARS